VGLLSGDSGDEIEVLIDVETLVAGG